MPASHERIPNKALAGTELSQIMQNHVKRVLERDGMFSFNLAYNNVAYEVKVSLHLSNPTYPEHVATIESAYMSKQEVEAHPSLAALQPPPLDADDAVVVSTTVKGQIQSPNHARAENGMPIPNEVRDPDTNTIKQRPIHYTGEIPPGEEVGNVHETQDTSRAQAEEWAGKKRKK